MLYNGARAHYACPYVRKNKYETIPLKPLTFFVGGGYNDFVIKF